MVKDAQPKAADQILDGIIKKVLRKCSITAFVSRRICLSFSQTKDICRNIINASLPIFRSYFRFYILAGLANLLSRTNVLGALSRSSCILLG